MSKLISHLKGVSALIFDMDGTLVNTEKLKFKTYNYFLNQIGLNKENELFEVYISLVGSTDLDAAKKIFTHFKINKFLTHSKYDVKEPWVIFYSEILDIFYSNIGTDIAVKNEIFKETLAILDLGENLNKKIAVATSSTTKEATRILKVISVFNKLDCLVTKDNIINPKPHPEIYLKTLSDLNIDISKQTVLCFEDSLKGILSAQRANLNWVGVPNEFTYKTLKSNKRLDQNRICYQKKDLEKVIEYTLN
tara:strand:+ start:1632 stop:2381 length:750 start_codon:yes stop_codon:yes gene_type:complete